MRKAGGQGHTVAMGRRDRTGAPRQHSHRYAGCGRCERILTGTRGRGRCGRAAAGMGRGRWVGKGELAVRTNRPPRPPRCYWSTAGDVLSTPVKGRGWVGGSRSQDRGRCERSGGRGGETAVGSRRREGARGRRGWGRGAIEPAAPARQAPERASQWLSSTVDKGEPGKALPAAADLCVVVTSSPLSPGDAPEPCVSSMPPGLPPLPAQVLRGAVRPRPRCCMCSA
jgi:hypothetical protein